MADTNLIVEVRPAGDWSVVQVRGEVDLYTAPKLKEHIVGLVDRGTSRIAVDLDGVEFLDSTGLGVLIGGLKRCREQQGDLAIVAPRDPVRKVLGITGLDRVFTIRETVEQATTS